MEEFEEIKGKNFSLFRYERRKTEVTLKYLQKVLGDYPQLDNEPKKILIVGLGSQPSLSKHMHLILKAAELRGVELVYHSLENPTLGAIGFQPVTPNFDFHKVLNFKGPDLIRISPLDVEPELIPNYIQFEKIKNNPIVGKSSKKG